MAATCQVDRVGADFLVLVVKVAAAGLVAASRASPVAAWPADLVGLVDLVDQAVPDYLAVAFLAAVAPVVKVALAEKAAAHRNLTGP